MFYVSKRIEVAGAHRLSLPYQSKCSNLHGHNWIITVHCKSAKLNSSGMVCDFASIGEFVKNTLDHQCINDVLTVNPTAENIAKYLCDNIENCYKVEVCESENNLAVYEI